MKKAKGAKSKIDVGQELRNLGALVEDNNHKLSGVAEQYGDLKKDAGDLKKDVSGIKKTLDSHTEMIGKLSDDVSIIKTNVEFLKDSLKKKVDYDEFIALEKRVSRVESKVGR